MGFFAKFRSIFSKKKDGKQDVSATAIKDTPAQPNEFSQASEEPPPIEKPKPPAKKESMAFDPNTTGPGRDSKECPKCGAPNDEDIHKCWLCKSEI